MTMTRLRQQLRAPLVLSGVLVASLLVSGCGSSDPATQSESGALEGEITVGAASSLTDVFTQLGKDFEAEHPGTTIRFTFDSSSTVANQIVEGAPIDLFASADPESMEVVTDADLTTGEPEPFAGNLLTLVTKAGNPTGFRPGYGEGLAGFDILALCAETAPCGRITERRIGQLDLDEGKITRAPNARATLNAVVEGDAEAGIVFATDALAAGDRVEVFELGMDEQSPDTIYPMAVLAGSDERKLAEEFAAFVLSDAGQDRLEAAGFFLVR